MEAKIAHLEAVNADLLAVCEAALDIFSPASCITLADLEDMFLAATAQARGE